MSVPFSILLSPKGFISVIGQSVKATVKAFRVQNTNVIVFHDNLNKKVEKYKID